VTKKKSLRTRNGAAFALESVPRLALEDFRAEVIGAPARKGRIASLFGVPSEEAGPGVRVFAVIARDEEGDLGVFSTTIEGSSFPSMTPDCLEVHLFERELAEQWGVQPVGHPWLKPVRFEEPRRSNAREDSPAQGPAARPKIGVVDYFRVEGDEVHEVAVGPVHAGVIEPGHFRFQCNGEHVFHLEISLGYQHRGVERALVGGPNKRTIHYMETLAGDTSVGHATAYCHAIEALSGTKPSGRAHVLRGIALELERLANHTGSLGALANDVAFLPTASYCGRLRGDFLNMTALLSGSRFGRGLVRPGGVGFDVDGGLVEELGKRLDAASRDLEDAVSLLWITASVQARLEDTGIVAEDTARSLGLVGHAARACGIPRDVRHNHPTGVYRFVQIPVSVWDSGDVFARAYVRWLELQRSIIFVREQLRALPAGAPATPPKPLGAGKGCVSMVEGWRGEICHVAMTDALGRFLAYKVVDPSFHNWMGLAMALRDQQISDFPLCNKSFDLSYCGFDL